MTSNYRVDDVMISHWSEYLNIPKYQWLLILAIGTFLSVFIIFFQPFGVTNHDPNFKINFSFVILMFSFGFIDSVVLGINEFIFKRLSIKEINSSNIIYWLVWSGLLTVTATFLYYNYHGNWHDLNWGSYFEFILNVGAVIAFPIFGFCFFLHHQFLKLDYSNFKLSQPKNKTQQMIIFDTDNPKERLTVRLGDLLYMKSENNYVAIFYSNNELIQEHLIRSSLKQLEQSLDQPLLQRCHRSYLINLANVINCQQSQHNLILNLTGLDKTIPVSKTHKKEVLERLQEFRT
jgi:hypothetical protein